MYLPSHFSETDLAVLHALMQANPLASLVTLTSDGVNADHIPLLLAPAEGACGVLRGHVARSNPVWQRTLPQSDVLAIFQGIDQYISPTWYPTKHEHGKAVPTWNYAVVHATGKLRVVDDPVWLRAQLSLLTQQHEEAMPQPWSIHDAPFDYIEKMIAAVVGIEIVITQLQGKWKVSQNQPAQNREGVVAGLLETGKTDAAAMAALVAQRAVQGR